MFHFSILRVTLMASLWELSKTQNCFGGIESFEKTTGSSFGPSVGTSVLLQQQDQALTRDCINLCKQQSQCLAFALDYAGFRCGAYNVNSVGRRDVLETRLNSNYFEKTCFHGVQKSLFDNLCGDRLWAFERVRDAFLNGYVEKETQNVQTKEECERLCLTEMSFICRSADYDEVMRVCRMSKEDRRSQPQAFREIPNSNRDYLENQCAASAPTSCRYDIRPGLSVISMDSLQFASSPDDCQIQCDSETMFNCRAYTYTSNRCFLSGDDSVSLGPIVLPEKPGSTYGEKMCVIEQCTGGAFTYEKMTGFVLRSAVQNSIMVSNPGSLGNTLECQEYCQRDGLDCPAFSVNYQNMRCDKLDRNSQGRTQDLVPRDGENYFEKICLRGPVATSCKNKAWAFERVLGHELEPQLYDRTVPFVQSRRDCEELCLEERSFMCRSALYNDDTTECKLSREDRRTLPTFYRRTNNMKMNYIENACLPVLMSCPYEESPDSYPTYTDHIQMAGITSNEVCEQFCSNYQNFNCRSYAYYSSNGQCFLSGDDRSSGSSGAVQGRPGLVYNERKCPTMTTPTETMTTPTTEQPPPSRQCSPGEIMMLEKTTGYQHLATISILYRGNPEIPGISSECRRMCELNYECRGFTLDYLKQECYSGVETSTTRPKELVPAENKIYFEGVCLPFYLGCSKQWMFDRYVDKELRGVQARDVIRLVSRTDCERRCLEERRFVCRSANYYRYSQECRLFAEERTIPHTQLSFASTVDYLENQCNIGTATCPFRPPERDMFMVYSSKAIPGITNFELCRQLCTRELEFNCRSYTYLEQGGLDDLCLLSSESRQTGQGAAVRYRLRAVYEETECRGQTAGVTTPTPPTHVPTPGTPSITPPTGKPPLTPQPPLPPPSRCTPDQYTYEKVTGYNVRFGRKEHIPTRSRVGIIIECQAHCQRLGERCKGFAIEYTKYPQTCFWLDAFSSSIDNTVMPSPGTTYFEKVCLSQTCGKLWSFERVPGFAFQEGPDLEMPGVPRRVDCEDICLRRPGTCRAATYDSFRRICRLFAETRRSRPGSFARDSPDMEYMENTCAVEPASCEYKSMPDRYFPYIDKLTRAYSLSDCQRQCDTEMLFPCRSMNYETVVRDCALSSEDTISLPAGPESLMPRANSIYSEKGDCEQVSVQCNQQDMLLTVNFGTPFHGRVYAKGNPTQCYMIGTGQTTLLFAISLGTRCGTVLENPGRYSNEVVIQEHPVIVTNSDKTIKVVCSFETTDRTVTLGALFPGASPGVDVTTRFQVPITAIVTNTAPPPNVVMRVLDRGGRDAGVVALGDDLMLRIELRDPASSLAIFARNLYARSKNGESLFLIDSTGCPTDPTIFPALNLDARDRKSLFANFKAFRFPSTGLVNFEVQIRFCQEQCKPIRCSNNMESYGKRKKRSVSESSPANASTALRYPTNIPEKHSQQSAIEVIPGTSSYAHTMSNTFSEDMTTRISLVESTTPPQNFESATVTSETEVQKPSTTTSSNYNYHLTSATTPRYYEHRPHPRIHDWWKIHLPRVPQRDPQHHPYTNMYTNNVRRNNGHYKNEAMGNVNLPSQPHRYNHDFRADSPHGRSDNHPQHGAPYNKQIYNMPPKHMNPHTPFRSANNSYQVHPLRNGAHHQLHHPSRSANNSHQVHPLRNEAQHHQLHHPRPPYSNPNIPQNRPSLHPHMDGSMHNKSYEEQIVSSSISFQQRYPMPPSSPAFDDKRLNQQDKTAYMNQRRRDMEGPTTKTSPQIVPPERHVQHRYSGNHQERYYGLHSNRTDFGNNNISSFIPERRHKQVDEFKPLKGGMKYTEYNAPELVVSTMIPVPDEVPLSLAIMVGEDAGMDLSSWDTSGKNDKFSQGSAESSDDGASMVCTTITTIVATAVALSLAHVGGVIGVFWVYRWHRKNKRKKLIQETLNMPRARPAAATAQLTRRLTNTGRQADGVFYAKPDVSFRNVYGSYSSSS